MTSLYAAFLVIMITLYFQQREDDESLLPMKPPQKAAHEWLYVPLARIPHFCLSNPNFLHCHCKSRTDCKQALVPFDKLLKCVFISILGICTSSLAWSPEGILQLSSMLAAISWMSLDNSNVHSWVWGFAGA